MEIEDTIKRESYREFDLVHLRHGNATQTRWYISHREAGMSRSFGYAASAIEARTIVDDYLKRMA